MTKKLDQSLSLEFIAAYQEHGTQKKAAAALGITQGKFARQLKAAKEAGLYRAPGGNVKVFESRNVKAPPKGRKHVFILTSAQNNTRLHSCWRDLLALAKHDDAQLMVSTFKYNKDAQGQRDAAKFETRDQELKAMYPHEIIPYVCDDRVNIAPNITFCGELNVLPTASNPLEGLESYTYRQSTIVPHPKLALVSVPAVRGEGVKLMYTTGCITQRNYIKRKVGYKAEAFHSYGALLVEVDDSGSWWCRQLSVGNDGAIYDLDRRVKDGVVTTGHRVENITWGDVHVGKIDPVVADISWGSRKDSILETLRPRSQGVHDLLDFGARSHHSRKDPHEVFRAHVRGTWGVLPELKETARVLWSDMARVWCDTYVVDSNHHRHLVRWLKEMDWRDDPENARTILQFNLRYLEAIAADEKDFDLFEYAMRFCGGVNRAATNITFLREDASHVILPKIDGGIECGIHADRGANGAKGSIAGMGAIDRKGNFADKHTIAINNHAYFAGTCALLDMGFNHGLTSWTHGDIITYPNGARAILSVWKGKWRA